MDFNADKAADIYYITELGGAFDQLYLNNGSASFDTLVLGIPTTINTPLDLLRYKFGDFNGGNWLFPYFLISMINNSR